MARFTPGVNIDNSGTNNISIRGIASSGGAGTTGIYIDDTPIQIRALAFNPDDALPKILRYRPRRSAARSAGHFVRRRIRRAAPSATSRPSPASLKTVSTAARNCLLRRAGPRATRAASQRAARSSTTRSARALTVWYRRDGGYIDRIDPVSHAGAQKECELRRDGSVSPGGRLWAPNENWTDYAEHLLPGPLPQRVENYWPLYSNPGNNQLVSGNPTQRSDPDRFYLAAMKIEGNLGFAKLISNTSYFHRKEQTGYEGTLYNLGFYQAGVFLNGDGSSASTPYPLLDGPACICPQARPNYRSPNSIDNGQQNITQEIRLQSANATSPLFWTAGAFFSSDRQTYLEQIHDPMLNELSLAATGVTYTDWFVDPNTGFPGYYDPRFPNDSYFLQTQRERSAIRIVRRRDLLLHRSVQADVGRPLFAAPRFTQ